MAIDSLRGFLGLELESHHDVELGFNAGGRALDATLKAEASGGTSRPAILVMQPAYGR